MENERASDFQQSICDVSLSEPYFYLSREQISVIQSLQNSKPLLPYLELLPGWVPQARVGECLGFSEVGRLNGVKYAGGNYCWVTEFENCHHVWRFNEISLEIDNQQYLGSEHYYQSQKPRPYNDSVWRAKRDAVMLIALRHKFANPDLRRLLLATIPHPLLSIKNDEYWGVTESGVGENRLARLLMQLRDEFTQGAADFG